MRDIEDRTGTVNERVPENEYPAEEDQVSFGSYVKDELIEQLKRVEPDILSPIEALSMLYDLVKKAKEC